MNTESRMRAARTRLLAALAVLAASVSPTIGAAGAAPARPVGAQSDDPQTQSDDAGGRAEIDIDVDVFRDDQADVSDTLDSLVDNVSAQLAQVQAARAALADAEAAVDEAQSVVAHTEARIEDLTAQSDEVVVETFVSPPVERSLEALGGESLTDAAVMQSILDTQASRSANVLEDLATARDELEVQRHEEEQAVDQAEAGASTAESELADLESAQSQQAVFVAQVQLRLDRRLAEAEALERLDPEMASRIREREQDLAAQIQEIRDAEAMAEALAALQLAQEQAEADARAEAERLAAQAAQTGDAGPATGVLVSVACPAGGSITVDSSLGDGLEAMMAAASADGFDLCGGGYRSSEEQIQLRIAHCGSSDYAIYEMPASECDPPTARPGTSKHEQGLAVDFTCNGSLISSQSSSCFLWLDANAASYGFHNLPAEPWHWSDDGG